MAMALVDFSFHSMMGKLEKMLEEETALLAGVEDDVKDIVAELRSITSFLTVMSTRRNQDAQLQNWVQEVSELAYDIEDSIDEFDCRLRSTPYDERGVKGFFKHALRSVKSLTARHGIASEIKKLKIQVEEVKKRHDRYSLAAASSDMADRYLDPRIISHFVEQAQLVGINQSRDKIMGWVMDENCLELTVISLVGFGGLGKTTLAKTIYDDSTVVGGHFQSRAWFTVSQNFNIKELLKKIIRQISVEEQQIRDVLGCQDAGLNTEQLLNMMDESKLVHTVRGHLHGKRYFLVFDDVWSPEAWESLCIALPQGKEGSRVIVTSRSEAVANACCSHNNRPFIFKVLPLSPDLSWELFCRKVFNAPDYDCPPELEDVGREIVQKCGGMPLAIVTIGGLLACKPDKKLEEWKDLRDHFRSEMQTDDMLSKINQILSLSYNDLPYHLKPCFLFLGTFPEDYEIRRKRLTRRWIAEGIVSGRGGFPAEKDAERCFNELVSRRETYIKELPNSIVKLQKLVHLLSDNAGLKLPEGIRNLKKLRTFGIVCADNVQLLQEIGELVDLEKLGISFGHRELSHRMLEEINALLSKVSTGRLRSLTIVHPANLNLKEALYEIAPPPLLLYKLHIRGDLGGLPSWFASLKQVVKIALYHTRLQLENLQVLRNLHTLVKLVLGDEAFDNDNEYLVFEQGGFAHLKTMEILMHSVSFKEGAVQSLEILKISCSTEQSVHSVDGMEHLHGLKEVHIRTLNEDIIEKVKNIAVNHSNRPKCYFTGGACSIM